MELDITGARILWETPINVPVLGQLEDQRDYGDQLACHASYHRRVHLAYP